MIRRRPRLRGLWLLVTLAALAWGGCSPEPLWPLRHKTGRCPYDTSLPRFDLVYTAGPPGSRHRLRISPRGALVEYEERTALSRPHTEPRCLDASTLRAVHASSVRVLTRIPDTFGPSGAAILEAGYGERIELKDGDRMLDKAWMTRHTELPAELSALLRYYEVLVTVLESKAGSPPREGGAGPVMETP